MWALALVTLFGSSPDLATRVAELAKGEDVGPDYEDPTTAREWKGYQAIVRDVSRADALRLLSHPSPVVRVYLARHVMHALPKDIVRLEALILDSGRVAYMPYDFGLYTTVGDVVARDLCDLPKNEVHKFMASVLAKAPTSPGAKGLLECLAKKDRALVIPHARVRLAARGADLPSVIEALGAAGDADSGPRILSYAEHLDRDVRRAVANAVGDLHLGTGLAAIHKMIDDADRRVMAAASRAYVRIPGFEPDVARRALNSRDSLQRDLTAEGLVLTGMPEALSLLREYAPSDHGTQLGPLLLNSPAGRAVLAENIHFDWYHWAARIRDDPAHADEILFHHDNGVRMAALVELTKHPQPALAPQVRKLLNDPEQQVRDWAARALKALGCERR